MVLFVITLPLRDWFAWHCTPCELFSGINALKLMSVFGERLDILDIVDKGVGERHAGIPPSPSWHVGQRRGDTSIFAVVARVKCWYRHNQISIYQQIPTKRQHA